MVKKTAPPRGAARALLQPLWRLAQGGILSRLQPVQGARGRARQHVLEMFLLRIEPFFKPFQFAIDHLAHCSGAVTPARTKTRTESSTPHFVPCTAHWTARRIGKGGRSTGSVKFRPALTVIWARRPSIDACSSITFFS